MAQSPFFDEVEAAAAAEKTLELLVENLYFDVLGEALDAALPPSRRVSSPTRRTDLDDIHGRILYAGMEGLRKATEVVIVNYAVECARTLAADPTVAAAWSREPSAGSPSTGNVIDLAGWLEGVGRPRSGGYPPA